MKTRSRRVESRSPAAFTIMEVLISALMIAMTIGSIATINARSIQTLRATRQAAASSQVLQQRIEMIRSRAWPEVAHATALAALLATPAESEKELSDANMKLWMKVSVPELDSTGVAEGGSSFLLRCERGAVTIERAGDLRAEPTLLFETSIAWTDGNGPHRRVLRTIVCRAGLTRTGIFGSSLGRPRVEMPSVP